MISRRDVKFECFRGKGPGGQHKNKTSSCVRATHIPTGIVVTVDGRSQAMNKKAALEEIEGRLQGLQAERAARARKGRRDRAIRDRKYVRTYDFKKKVVIDHRSGKRAPLGAVLDKGQIELLR